MTPLATTSINGYPQFQATVQNDTGTFSIDFNTDYTYMWNQRCFFTSYVKGVEENCSSNSYLKINGIFDDQNATYV